MSEHRAVAMIPARAGSVRIPGKNVRLLAGHPLIAYTIVAARTSGCFTRVLVSTDSPEVAEISTHYGAEILGLRPEAMARPRSPDIEWVEHLLDTLKTYGHEPDVFAILRPTSPLRQPATIRRAVDELESDADAHSLRAVERCRQHPGKMWTISDDRLQPLLDDGGVSPPWHSRPYQDLPEIFVQNASLEVARTAAVRATRTISGNRIRPFDMPGHEGFDLNDEWDWWVLERLLSDGTAALPAVDRDPPAVVTE